ncbi:MAG: hypothetical protein OEY85_02265 [Rhodospirillales bacterium]|nr:hypothetical protein [Rhodospirillales bacterium]
MGKTRTLVAIVLCYALVGIAVTFWRDATYGSQKFGMIEDALFWPAVIFFHLT